MDQDLDQLSSVARQLFVRAAQGVGLPAREEGHEIACGIGGLRVFCRVVQCNVRPRMASVQVAIEAASPRLGEPLRDTCAGVGATPEEAIVDAVEAWVAGPLEMLREVLAEPPAEPRYEFNADAVLGRSMGRFSVYESPLQLAGPPEVREALLKLLEDEPLFARLATAQLLPPLEPGRTHWLKLYAARFGDTAPVGECRLDGVNVDKAADALAQLPWPESDRIRSVRQYLVFVPTRH